MRDVLNNCEHVSILCSESEIKVPFTLSGRDRGNFVDDWYEWRNFVLRITFLAIFFSFSQCDLWYVCIARLLIPMPILRPIPMELGVIVFLRRVYSGLIPIRILMQMGFAPNLAPISVLIRWFFKLISIVTLDQKHHRNLSECSLFAYYRNQSCNRHKNRSRTS